MVGDRASRPAPAESRPSRTSSASSSVWCIDLVAAAEVRVLVGERVEAVRAARDDLRHAGLVQRLDVLLGERLEHVLVAHPPGRVAGARLARPEDREVDARRLEQLRGRARASRGRARRTTRRSRPSRAPPAAPRPARAPALRAPRSSRPAPAAALPHGFDERSTSRSIGSASAGNRASTITRWRRRSTMWSMCSIETGHSRTHAPQVTQSQTTSSVTAFGTSGAMPAAVVAGQQLRPLGEQLVAQAHDQELRRQLLAGRPRRADVLAAAALGAREGVDHLLPGHVGDRAGAEPDLVLGHVRIVEPQRLEPAAGARAAEVDVDRRR